MDFRLDKPSKTCSDGGVDFEVVWDGGPLLPPRDQKPDHSWVEGRQQVNKNRKYRKPEDPASTGSKK